MRAHPSRRNLLIIPLLGVGSTAVAVVAWAVVSVSLIAVSVLSRVVVNKFGREIVWFRPARAAIASQNSCPNPVAKTTLNFIVEGDESIQP